MVIRFWSIVAGLIVLLNLCGATQYNYTIGSVTNDNIYTPNPVIVNPGDVVQWTWYYGLHSLTTGASCGNADPSAGYSFDMVLVQPGDVASYTFANPGYIQIYCKYHCPTMVGAIIVRYANGTQPTAPPPPPPPSACSHTSATTWLLFSLAFIISAISMPVFF